MFDTVAFVNAYGDYCRMVGHIPTLAFNDNNSLTSIVQKLTLIGSTVDYTTLTPETAPTKLAQSFEYAFEHLDDKSLNEINSMITTFSDRIRSGVQLLTGVGDTAEALASQIEKQRDTLLALNPYPAIHLKRNESDLDYTLMPWDDTLLLGGEQFLIDKLHSARKIESPISNITVQVVRNKLPFVVDQNAITDLKLSEEAYNSVLSTLTSLYKSRAGVTDIPGVLLALIKGTTAQEFGKQITTLTDNGINNTADACVKLLAIIRNASPILECVRQGVISLSDEHNEALEKNAETLWSYLEFAGYYITVCRRTTYAEAIMLPNGMINGDVKDEFISAGGSMLMVYHHQQYVFKEGIPNVGISYRSVLDQASNILSRVTEDTRNIDTRITAIDNDIRRKSFMHVMSQYALKTIEEDPDKGQKFKPYDHLLQRYSTAYVTNNVGLVDCIYGFILNQQYSDTFTSLIYYALGSAYTRNLKANVELTNEDVNLIEVGVFSSLVAEFCADMFVKH